MISIAPITPFYHDFGFLPDNATDSKHAKTEDTIDESDLGIGLFSMGHHKGCYESVISDTRQNQLQIEIDQKRQREQEEEDQQKEEHD